MHDMDENPGPCFSEERREPAVMRLDKRIANLERRLTAMRMLRKIASDVEVGSPLEELLYELADRINGRF